MAQFAFEVVAHGRVNIIVDAETVEEAKAAASNHPGVPDFDKFYDLDINFIGEV